MILFLIYLVTLREPDLHILQMNFSQVHNMRVYLKPQSQAFESPSNTKHSECNYTRMKTITMYPIICWIYYSQKIYHLLFNKNRQLKVKYHFNVWKLG